VRERTAELRQRVEDLALINSLNVAINRGDGIQEIIVTLSDELHRIFDCIGTITAFPTPDNKPMSIRQMGSMLIIPLISGTETYGLLEMVRREQSSEAEVLRIQDIAGHLAAAIGRKLAEERIRKTLREKEMLIRELYHRTKNSMQMISGMMALQAGDFSANSEVQLLVDNTNERIQAISLVHEMLLQSQDLSRISIEDYIGVLSAQIVKGYASPHERVVINQVIDDQHLLFDTAIPLGMILNELITNSLKHAFPGDRKGTINIVFRKEGSRCRLRYSDDGVGVPAGFDFRNSGTLGLTLVHDMGEQQMKGKVVMENDSGIRVSFEFPDDLYKARV
jgi:two-component sensor histidine kinase